jgi:mannosyltransferase
MSPLNFRKIVKKHQLIIIPVGLMLINFLTKGVYLAFNSLAGDEPFTVFHAQMDVSSIISLLSVGNNPPLFEILLHYWIKLFGIGEFAVRFPSLIFSSISVLFIYQFGVKYLNQRIGLYASGFYIFSNYHVLFSQEARAYALLGMLSIMSMYYFLSIINNVKIVEGQKVNHIISWPLIVLTLVNTLIIYTHYFGFLILITQLLLVILDRKLMNLLWKKILVSGGMLTLLYAPYIALVFQRFISSSRGTWVPPPTGLVDLYYMLRFFTNEPVVTISALVILFCAVGKYIYKGVKRPIDTPIKLVLFWFLFIFLLMFGVSFKIPIFIDRYVMPASVGFLLTLAVALDYLSKNTKYYIVLPTVLFLMFVFSFNPKKNNKRNVRETVEWVKKIKSDQTVIYICADWFDLNFIYYYNQEVFKNYDKNDSKKHINKYLKSQKIYPINSYSQIQTTHYESADKVIFLDAAAYSTFPENKIKEHLNLIFDLKSHHYFYEIFNVYEYSF